tara:strand:+ start:124 stop:324 length:201 start_codon:yes stop_codon:yes gene_type:complete
MLGGELMPPLPREDYERRVSCCMCFPVKLGIKLLAFAAIYLAVDGVDGIYKSFKVSVTYGVVFSFI